MISAKDEFFLEREMINELSQLIRKSDLTGEELSAINFNEITIEEYERLKSMLSQRELSPLEAARRGCTLSAKQIKEAVKKAANNE